MGTTVTDTGLAAIIDRLTGEGTYASDYIDWCQSGTGSSASETTQTDLVTAVESRVQYGAAAIDQPTAVQGRWVKELTYTGTRAITEFGMFLQATGAHLAFYADFSVITAETTDTIEFTSTISAAQA